MPNAVKPIRISNPLTHSAVRISLQRRDESGELKERGQCTGFFWQYGDDLYVITNWHCVTGWHPIEDRKLDDMGFTPEFAKVPIDLLKEEEVEGIKTRRSDRRVALIELRPGDEPDWFEHPKFGRQVDVVAIKIGPVAGAQLISKPINTSDFTDYHLHVGDDAFVLGFPKRIDGGFGFPIWKRASIATEPDIDIDSLPKLLIDTATRQGMSGAPVIAVRRGYVIPRGKEPKDAVIGEVQSFLGVYSSREGDDPMGVQLGTVWKASVVAEIVEGGVKGRGPHDP
jgi:hypothetical protein